MSQSVQRRLDEVERAAFAALAEALTAPVVAVEADERVLASNAAARALLPALRTGTFLQMALRAPEVIDAVRRVAAGGEAERATWSERVPVERLFEVNVAPVALAGAFVIVLSFHDLTEPRRLERMRADFIANASHELRTPLASLLGFVETLQGPARDDAQARVRFLPIMAEQARRMSRLIDDLLSLSRIEQREHVRPTERVDLADVARRVAGSLDALAREDGARLDLALAQDVVVRGDADELFRVAENLVENAIKYGAQPGEGARVRVEVARQGGDAVFAVSDQGPGVAREHLPRLTERFYRADAATSRAKGGTGLGLAIVKHIVVRHGGRLTIESEPGAGATFRALIPLSA
jgi:two-component system phosphate regulon sensor histidine kinase PhoR